jgi:hypothetical protein
MRRSELGRTQRSPSWPKLPPGRADNLHSVRPAPLSATDHSGPGGTGVSAPAGSEDGGDASAVGRQDPGAYPRRSSAGEGIGAGVPISAAAGRGALRLDQRNGCGGADGAGVPRHAAAADAAGAGHRRKGPRRPATRRRDAAAMAGAVSYRMAGPAYCVPPPIPSTEQQRRQAICGWCWLMSWLGHWTRRARPRCSRSCADSRDGGGR